MNNNYLRIYLVKKTEFNQILKRFSQIGPGGKKLGEKLAEKTGEQLSKSSPMAGANTSAISTTSSKISPYPEKKYSKEREDQKANEPKSSIPPSNIKNITKYPTNITADQKQEYNSIQKFLDHEPKIIKEENDSKIPFKNKFIDIELYSSEENTLPEDHDDKQPKIVLVAVNLVPKDPQQLTPEEKHICVGTKQDDGQVVLSSFLTSSAAHSQEKHNHGKPQNIKVSDTKVDGSYTPQIEKSSGIDDQGNKIKVKVEKRIPAQDNEDGGGMTTPSPTKGGQYARQFKTAICVEKDQYNENDKAMDHIKKNPDVYNKLVDIHVSVVEKDHLDNNKEKENETENSDDFETAEHVDEPI